VYCKILLSPPHRFQSEEALPVKVIAFLPVGQRIEYTPATADLDKVIAVAPKDVQEYLWTIRETMERVSQINRLTWNDVA
jgi:hypothetical protein